MNKICKVIWNDARECYVVVAEIAKNHGKKAKSVFGRVAADIFSRAAGWAMPLVAAGLLLTPATGWAATEITPKDDAHSGSVINNNGRYDVYAQEVAGDGSFAVNRFKKFNLANGDIANMYFKLKDRDIVANSLVNLVKDRIDIQGTVNAIRNGKIDGNLYFISPKGLAVGSTGVINAGSFTAIAANNHAFLSSDESIVDVRNYFDSLWESTGNIGLDLEKDIKNLGRKDAKGQYIAMERLAFNNSRKDTEGIDIKGRINTRSGIVLGASNIHINKGAILQSDKSIDFNGLVNTSAVNAGLGDDLNLTTDAAGDIILRAESSSSYTDAPLKVEHIRALSDTTNEAEVKVEGTIESDGKVDISAGARTSFDNTNWNAFSELGLNVSDLVDDVVIQHTGINWAVDWANKTNTASVRLTEDSSVTAGGQTNLQADARTDVTIEAQTAIFKEKDSSGAIPVTAIAVVTEHNKATVDAEGKLISNGGGISLGANAIATLDMNAKANTKRNPMLSEPFEDPEGNRIYLAVGHATGDNIAEVNVKELAGGDITTPGAFSARSATTSSMSVNTAVTGLDQTVASTAVSVIDFNTDAKVNLGRSVTAQSIKGTADNKVSRLNIKAADGNGEGYIIPTTDGIKFFNLTDSNARILTDKANGWLKSKFDKDFLDKILIRKENKLSEIESLFEKVQQYITAGAGVATLNNRNDAHVTVSPDVTLKATGGQENGSVDLSAGVGMNSLHHSVTGQANKQDEDTQSDFVVAAGVLVSKVENDAAVELQSDDTEHKGVSLVSENGSVNLKAETRQNYDPLEPFKLVKAAFGQLKDIFEKDITSAYDNCNSYELADTGYKNIMELEEKYNKGEITEKQLHTGSLDNFLAFLSAFNDEVENLVKIDKQFQKIIAVCANVLDPAAYTNYYSRSYVADSNENKAAIAASVNIAGLHDRSVVSLGESASITAGTRIAVDTATDTHLLSGTGNGSEYFGYSQTNGNGVGASIAVQDFTGDSMILSGKGVSLSTGQSDGGIAMNASNKMNQTGVILSAGEADGMMGITGSVNVLTGESNSLVLVDDETTVTTAGALTMKADNSTTATNVVGGLSLGSSKTAVNFGGGLSLNLLDVNSIAAVGDNGTDASVTATSVDTDDFKKKTVEEQNKIKAENTLVDARKLARESTSLSRSLGSKTAQNAKGSLTAKDIEVIGKSSGTIDAVALEGAYNASGHSALDTVNNIFRTGSEAKSQLAASAIGVVNWPLSRFDGVLSPSSSHLVTKWEFGNLQPIEAPGGGTSSSFNAALAGSFSWNKVKGDTASFIDNAKLYLGGANGNGLLRTSAVDDVFNGAWSGAAAVNWFSGGGLGASGSGIEGALGTAVAVNDMSRDVKAVIGNAEITGAGLIDNTAVKEGTDVATALGLAVTNDSSGSYDGSVAFGLSLNQEDNGVHALLIDDSSENTSGATDINSSAYDGDIQVAGGVDLAYANAAAGGGAIAAGITAAVSKSDNDIQSGVQGGSYQNVKDLQVTGEDSLTQVNVAAGLGFNGAEKGFTGSAAVAYSKLDNTNHGYISGTEKIEASGTVSATTRDISRKNTENYTKSKQYLEARGVDAAGTTYLSDSAKQEMGSGSEAVNVAVQVAGSRVITGGAAITVSEVDNKFSSEIKDNGKLAADTVKGESDVNTNIVAVGVGVSVSTKSFGGAGSLAFNLLDQDNIVSITGNRTGEADSGITANHVSGTTKNTSHIVNVTGDFAGGKNAVGLGIAYNSMDDTTGVYAAGNRIRAEDASKGVEVVLDATNDAHATAVSVGASVTYGGSETHSAAAVHGNIAANSGRNDTVVVIGEDRDGKKAGDKDIITNASLVEAKAADNTSKTTAAGSAELAIKETTVALGVGMALTETETAGKDKEIVRAEINNADISTVRVDDKAAAVNAESVDKSRATTVAVGVGITTEKSVVGAQGVGADARIKKTNTAGMKDTTIDTSGAKGALVTVSAETASTLKTGAAAMQISGPDSFLTGVVAVGTNRIKDDTTAGVTYTNGQENVSQNVGNLDIRAASDGDILSVAMGTSVGADGMAALGGSGSYNYIENNSTAQIKNANISSAGNVGVVARSDEAISNYAGMLDVGAGGNIAEAAVGVTGSNNRISGDTIALIQASKVVAMGSDSSKIKTMSSLKNDSLISGPVTSKTWKSGGLRKGREAEEMTGVVVDASATHAVASVMANAGVGAGGEIGGSVAGIINLNAVKGSTQAKVLDSKLNDENNRSDVTVHAADYTNVAEFSGAAAVGVSSQGAVTAGFTGTTNKIDRVTAAGVSTSSARWNDEDKRYEISDSGKEKNKIYAKDFAVTADAKQAMSAFNLTFAGTVSGGLSLETGDNVNTNKMGSSTIATVTNATVDFTDSATVKASHEDRIYNLNVDAGLAVGAGAGSLNVGVGVVNEDSVVTADVENSDLKASDNTSNATKISVGADNKTTLEAQLVSVGVAAAAAGAGLASSVAVNNVDTKVTSRIAGSNLEAKTIDVKTSNELRVKDATGYGGAAWYAGIGIGADVNTFNDTVATIVENSTVTAKEDLTVSTETTRDITATTAGAGVGVAGVPVNVLAVTVNGGVNSLGKAQDGDAGVDFDHQAAIESVLNSVNNDTGRDLSDNFYGLNANEKQEMQKDVKTAAKSGAHVDGTGVHTYVRNGSELKSDNSLKIMNTEANGSDLNGGSGAGGIGAVNVSDVVFHLNELNDIAIDDSTVTGKNVNMYAWQESSAGSGIRAKTVQASMGAAGIGVGYAGITTKGNTGIRVNHGTITATGGDVSLYATDNAVSESSMVGVSAGLLAVPVSVAHNTNQANTFVTVEGGSTLSGDTVNMLSLHYGNVDAKTTGVGAGGADVAVTVAKARNYSTSGVNVNGTGNIFNANKVVMESTNATGVSAEAGGGSGAALGIGVWHSNATAKSGASVTVADGNSLLADDVTAKAVVGKKETDLIYARTNPVSVSVVNISPSKAKAVTETNAKVSMGTETYKAGTDLSLLTENNIRREAILDAVTVGVGISIASGDAKTESNDRSIVEAKGGESGQAVKLRNLTINAGGESGAKGLANGGSGGAVDMGAMATVNLNTQTTNTASLSGAWDVSGNADIAARQTVNSKGSSKTGEGGVLSMVGANSHNEVKMTAKTELAEGTQLTAGRSSVQAVNTVNTDSYDDNQWSNYMAAGGYIQITPQLRSAHTVKTEAEVDVGKNVEVSTGEGQVYNAQTIADIKNKTAGESGGAIADMGVYTTTKVDSANKVTVGENASLNQKGNYEDGKDITISSSDNIKLDTVSQAHNYGYHGGLYTRTNNDVTRNNSVKIDGNLSSTHDVNLYAGVNADGTDSVLNIKAMSASQNYTMFPFALPEVNLERKNKQQVTVGTSGSATAWRHINLSAVKGNETYRKDTKAHFTFCDTDKNDHHQFFTVTNLSGDSNVKSTDANYVDVEGRLKAGIQNNVQIDITGVLLPATVTVREALDSLRDIVVHHHLTPVDNLPSFNVEVTNKSGTSTDAVIKKEDIRYGEMDYAAQLGTQKDQLTELIAQYSNGNKDENDTIAYLGYKQQLDRIIEEMDRRHLYTVEPNGEKLYLTEGFTVGYVRIPEINVSGGNIVVQSDNLIGHGSLDANGSPNITINNLSNAYLKLDGLNIWEKGGEVRFQKTTIDAGNAGKEQIKELNKLKGKIDNIDYSVDLSLNNDAGSSAASVISVLNDNTAIGTEIEVKSDQTDKTGPYPSVPDVAVLGNIANHCGDVTIENRQGNIVIGSGGEGKSADVTGTMVKMIADQGSISQDYIDGIVNIGGNPEDLNKDDVNLYVEHHKFDNVGAGGYLEPNQSSGGRIAGGSVYLAAADINVNGLIQSGYGKYVADIGEDALSDENIAKLKNSGREVTIQGRTMYKLNDGNKAVYDASSGAYNFVVQVYYDPEKNNLVVENIDTQGGRIYLTGRISSTGNGKLLAMDGGAEIAITNNTGADLLVGKILNNNVEGKIIITDLARDTWTEYTRSQTTTINDYTSHIKNNDLDRYKQIGAGVGRYDKDNPAAYAPKENLRYTWTMGQETTLWRKYELVDKGIFWGIGKIKDKSEGHRLDAYETADTLKEEATFNDRELQDGHFIDVLTPSDFSVPLGEFTAQSSVTLGTETKEIVASYKEGGHWYFLGFDPKYHTVWTSERKDQHVYYFSLKADRSIDIGFLGQENGNIAVNNTNEAGGDIYLNGNIQSSTPLAVLTVNAQGGSIIQKSGTSLTTGNADLKAKDNIENIHITSMGAQRNDGVNLSVVSADGGNIDVTVAGGSSGGQSLPGNVVLNRLASEKGAGEKNPGDVSLTAQGSITQTSDNAAVEGRKITLTSENGNIGSLTGNRRAVIVKSFAEANGASEDSASVNATAKKDIFLAESDGDMRVGSIVSREGDVRLEAEKGRLIDALPRSEDGNNIDEDDLIRHWIDSGLIAGTADYEGAYIKGLKEDAAKYKERVTEQFTQFREYQSSGGESSLRQKFTKAGSSETYASVQEYLAQDKYYQALPASGKKAYEEQITSQFNLFTADDSIRQKFTKEDGTYYLSPSEYLENDAEYQQIASAAQDKTGAYVRQVNEEFTAFRNGDPSYRSKFTKADGTTYDTVAQYLQEDEAYQGFIKDKQDYEDKISREFINFTANKSNGQLTDMFTKADGTVYASADAYLEDDATYQAMVEKSTNPQYLWTKDQLLYSIRNAIVNKESGVSAETQSKIANVQGKNITLKAKGVGMNLDAVTEIKVSDIDGGSNEAIANLKKLANADAADVTMLDARGNILRYVTEKNADGNLDYTWKAYDADQPGQVVQSDYVIDKFVIGNKSPLGVYAKGTLNIEVDGENAFVAGRSSGYAGFSGVNVGQIEASGADVRLYTQKGVYNALPDEKLNTDSNIDANDLIIYGGTESIGEKDKPLTVKLSGDLLTAAADKNIYIKNLEADSEMRLGSIYAGNTIGLESAKGFKMTSNPDYTLAYLNAGKQYDLRFNPNIGVFGEANDPIRFLNNGTVLNLKARDAYVKGMKGSLGDNTTLKLGEIEVVGNFGAASEGNLEAGVIQPEEKDEKGNVVKPLVIGKINAGNDVKLEAVKELIVSGPVSAGKLRLGADGQYTGGGRIDLVSIEGAIMQNAGGALTASRVNATGGKGITLTNEGNTFREFTAFGTDKTDAQGNREKAIDGSVAVSAHAGKSLRAGLDSATVYGDVSMRNRDDGNLVVNSAIVTKAGKNGEAGNISFHQDRGGIFVIGRVRDENGQEITGEALEALCRQIAGYVSGELDDAAKERLAEQIQKYDFERYALKAGGDVSVSTKTGLIGMLGDVVADRDIIAESDGGRIILRRGIDAGRDVTVKTGGDNGYIFLNMLRDHTKNVHAGRNVSLTTDHTGLVVAGTVVTTAGSVNATTKTGVIDFVGNVTSGKDIVATVTEGNDRSKIKFTGTTTAKGDVKAILPLGEILYEKAVHAGGSIYAHSNEGNIAVNEDITAGGDITLEVAEKGTITVGETDGTGIVSAGGDISITTKNGDTTVKTSIESTGGSVSVEAEHGNIRVGDVAAQYAIQAKKDVKLHVADGVITVNGRTETQEGDILAEAMDEETAQNIVITHNGVLDSGRDLTLHTYNGDIEVTDRTLAKRNLLVIVDNQGDISFGRDIAVAGDVDVTTNKGDITIGKNVSSEQGSVGIRTKGGSILVGDNDPDVETVTAYQDVKLTAEGGRIEVYGKTLTKKGDIIMSAGTDRDVAGDTGKRIVVARNGEIEAGRDATLIVNDGDILVAGKVDAKRSFNSETQKRGNIIVEEEISVSGGMSMKTESGDITVGQKVDAGKDVNMETVSGNIAVGDDITAGSNVKMVAAQTGNITVGENDGTGNIAAGGSVDVLTKKGDIRIGNNGRDVETITAKGNVSLIAESGKLKVRGKTSSATGDITLMAASDTYDPNALVLDHSGRIAAGRDANLSVENGDLHLADELTVKRDLNIETRKRGDITLDDDLTALRNASMKTDVGSITAGKTITAVDGTISMETGTGELRLQKDAIAGEDVNITAGVGNITVGGSNGRSDVTAGRNVTMTTGGGKIEVFGNISTPNGDVVLKAVSDAYTGGPAGQVIVLDRESRIDAGRDATLDSTNGDVRVTHQIAAKHDISVITRNRGDIYLDREIDADPDDGSVILKADKGNITAAIDPAVNGRYKITAGKRIEAFTGDGDVAVGEVDGRYVSLVSRGEEGNVTAETIRAEARGDAKGTGKEDIRLGGGYLNVDSIVKKGDSTAPLTISTMASSEGKAAKVFNIGRRNNDGSYTGGIASDSGAVIQQLWVDSAMLYTAGDTNLHISKLVVNDKLHLANDRISVAAYGRVPTHDGERVVYWNHIGKNVPADRQDLWYDGSYSDPGWMNLDLFGDGAVGSRYGTLVDAQGYRNLYGDSVSVVDIMRKRLAPAVKPPEIVDYDRGELIQLNLPDELGAVGSEGDDEITVES